MIVLLMTQLGAGAGPICFSAIDQPGSLILVSSAGCWWALRQAAGRVQHRVRRYELGDAPGPFLAEQNKGEGTSWAEVQQLLS